MNNKNQIIIGRILKSNNGLYSFKISIDDMVLAKKIKEMDFFILANDYKNVNVKKGYYEEDMNYV